MRKKAAGSSCAENKQVEPQLRELLTFLKEVGATLMPLACWLIAWLGIFIVVDPYGGLGWFAVDGFNTIKPLQFDHARISKPLAFLKGDYDGVILGASGVLHGIDPDSLVLRGAGHHFYNFGLVEERPYEAEKIAEFAIGTRAIRTIILDLEFTRYDVAPALLRDPRPYYPDGPILSYARRQYLRAALSLQGIIDCYATFIASRRGRPVERLTQDGRTEEVAGRVPGPLYDYEAHFASGLGHYLNDILPIIATQSEKWMDHGFDHGPLRKIIELAGTHQIRFIAFIAPEHALQMEALRQKGLWQVFEHWKRELIDVFQSAAARYPNAEIALWDFSGYNAVTTEPLPRSEAAERSTMHYWDEVHYTVDLGDMVLRSLLQSKSDLMPRSDFGTKLTISNIESHLAAIRADQATYKSSHPDDLRWLNLLDRSKARQSAVP